MATLDRIETLRRQHSSIDTRIDEEESRPHPDDVVLTDLKRQKLRIKDTIAELSRVV
ncbi:MAG: YdcH family protein [Alphaproteobacteria bacterium]